MPRVSAAQYDAAIAVAREQVENGAQVRAARMMTMLRVFVTAHAGVGHQL
jgi:hypothetical protein